MSSKTVPKSEQHKVIRRGTNVTIWSIAYCGEFPAFDFIEDLTDGERVSLLAIFKLQDLMPTTFRNPQKFKKLLEHNGMTFLEFKSGQVRIGCFWQSDFQLYATHGFMKKQDDWPAKEILRLKNIYEAWKESKERENGKK